MIYETKGLSLEEVDELYSEVSVARKSVGWRPSRSFVQRASVAGQGGMNGNGHMGGEKEGYHVEHDN